MLLQKLREESRAVFLQRRSRELLDNDELQVRLKARTYMKELGPLFPCTRDHEMFVDQTNKPYCTYPNKFTVKRLNDSTGTVGAQ